MYNADAVRNKGWSSYEAAYMELRAMIMEYVDNPAPDAISQLESKVLEWDVKL